MTGELFTIRKVFKFEAAHRLVSSYSEKCQQIHGHSYKMEVFLQSDELNNDGMVLDFGCLKDEFAASLEVFDHKIVLSEKDPLAKAGMEKFVKRECPLLDLGIIYVPFNPTAENMAKFFYEFLESRFYEYEDLRNIRIKAVRIHETETGWAEYSKEL